MSLSFRKSGLSTDPKRASLRTWFRRQKSAISGRAASAASIPGFEKARLTGRFYRQRSSRHSVGRVLFALWARTVGSETRSPFSHPALRWIVLWRREWAEWCPRAQRGIRGESALDANDRAQDIPR
jgi:hypothetical protein